MFMILFVVKFADWEKNPRYCEKIKRKSLYRQGRRLLDLMDMAVFDFLLGMPSSVMSCHLLEII